MFGRREVFGGQRFAQLRGKTAVVSGDPLPFRGNQPGCAQRFEQQRQQLVVRRLQRFCEQASQQSGNLRFGRVALEDADSSIRRVAVEAFQNMGGAAERYLPRLMPRLYDEDKDVRLALVDLLGQIGTSAVMPHLISALRDENEWVRIRAIEALGTNKNLEAVPKLSEMLENASPMVVFRIIEALGRIGGNVAFSVLLSMADNEDPEIQRAAADAVSAIQAEQE